ncbi:hypothetical protein G6F57_017801 [Rhizopus arrhizus]|nr:hypothetical protein G6F57_017801 [Rhizopus arrhizus]
MLGHDFQVALQPGLGVEPGNAVARGHQAVGGAVAQAHDTVHHVALVGIDHAGLMAFGHQHADLFFGHRGDFILAQAEQPQHQLGGPGQQPHEGKGQFGQPAHRHRHQAGNGLRTGQRQALGNQFAEDQGDEGDQADRQRSADVASVGKARHQALDPAGEGLAQRFTAEVAGQHADHGDADLHGGQEALRLFRQLQCLGGPLGGGGHLLQAALARGHDRHLGHGEEAVQQNKREDNQDHFKHGRRPRLVAGRAGACDGGWRAGAGAGAALGDKGRRP